MLLAAPRQRTPPQPPELRAEQRECRIVGGNSLIPDVPFDHGAQPLAHRRDGVVQAAPEFAFHLAQFGLLPFAHGLPEQRVQRIMLAAPGPNP